ncbi:MAG TPA: tetratricopeptide repeat protein, partial [Herpetosiphonaceae bacterium]
SYDALPPPAQAALRQLGALVADFDIGLGLAAIGQGDDGEDQLHALLRRNLVSYAPASARWRLHDLIRTLALRKLIEAGEHDEAQWRYADAVLALLGVISKDQHSGASITLQEIAEFDRNRPHFGALWEWANRQRGDERADAALVQFVRRTMGIGTSRYNNLDERRGHLEAALAAAERLQNPEYQTQMLSGLGSAYLRQGKFAQAIDYYEAARSIIASMATPDKKYAAIITRNIATAYSMLQGSDNLRKAIELHYQALNIFKDLDLADQIGITLNNIGITYIQDQENAKGIEVLSELIDFARIHNFNELHRFAISNIAEAHINSGDPRSALPLFEETYNVNKALGLRSSEAYGLIGCGRSYAALDRPDDAFNAFEEGLIVLLQLGNQWAEADCRWHYGLALARYGEIDRALPQLRAAQSYEQSVGHAKAAEHQALIARMEAGETLTTAELEAAGR